MSDKPDIMTVMDSEGIELKRRGRDFWACCPFHADKSPSFKVSPERQSFHCFGCGAHGDVFDFTMTQRGIPFKEALRVLGVRRGRSVKPDPAAQRRRVLVKSFRAWQRAYYYKLCDESIVLHQIRIGLKANPDQAEDIAFVCAEALGDLPLIEHRLDTLQHGSDEDRYELFKEIAHGV